MTRWSAWSKVVRALIALIVLALPIVLPTAAQAHALLDSSTPADGASYAKAPAAVDLNFSENVEVNTVQVQLVDGSGVPIDLEAPAVTGSAAAAKSNHVSVPLPDLPKGRYLLRWQTVSADDLHLAAGSIAFGIGTAVTGVGDQSPGGWAQWDGVVEALLRWSALVALGCAMAAVVLLRLSARRAVLGDGVRGIAAMAAIGTTAAALLGAFYLVRIAAFAGASALVTAWSFTLRWVIAVALGALAWALLRRARRAGSWPEAALLAGSVLGVTATTHPASLGMLSTLIAGVHTLTTLAWACGAAVVAGVAVPALRRGDRNRAADVARAFTPIAVVAVPISIVTGLVLAGYVLPSVGALFHTQYGQALLVKMGLLVASLLCAAGTVAFLVIERGRRRIALVVGVEAVLLGAVVLAASILAATHPASSLVWAPSPAAQPTQGVLSEFAQDLVVTAAVGPGQPGRNFVTIGVLDTRRPAPAPISSVSVAAGGAPALAAVNQGNYQWVAFADAGSEGPLPLTIRVTRAGEPTVTVPFTWLVGPAAGTKQGGDALTGLVAWLVTGVVALTAFSLLAWLLVARHLRGRDSEQLPSRVRKESASGVKDA